MEAFGTLIRTADRKPFKVVGVGQNSTDRKHAEEALRESQAQLQKAVSIETVGVLFFRRDGRITDANVRGRRGGRSPPHHPFPPASHV